MKRFLLACLAVMILAGAVLVFSSRNTAPAVSLRIQTITNDAAGQPVAVLTLTKHKSVAVILDSFGYKLGEAWGWQQLPTNQIAELQPLIAVNFFRQGSRPASAFVHFPTSPPWRLRLEVVEPRSGIDGLIERLRNPTGFYRKGGVLNVIFGNNPSRYTGRVYYLDSEEIQ